MRIKLAHLRDQGISFAILAVDAAKRSDTGRPARSPFGRRSLLNPCSTLTARAASVTINGRTLSGVTRRADARVEPEVRSPGHFR
jgi:hypothetical protein